MTAAARIAEQLAQAKALLEVDGYEYSDDGIHVWGVGGDRWYSEQEAEAFCAGLVASRGGAHLRFAAPEHDAGAYVKATRGEVAREPAARDLNGPITKALILEAEEEARERATCSRCLARTYRGEECVCEEEGDAEEFEEALAAELQERGL